MASKRKGSVNGIRHKQGTKEGDSKEWQRKARRTFQTGQTTIGSSTWVDGKKFYWTEVERLSNSRLTTDTPDIRYRSL